MSAFPLPRFLLLDLNKTTERYQSGICYFSMFIKQVSVRNEFYKAKIYIFKVPFLRGASSGQGVNATDSRDDLLTAVVFPAT